MPQIPAQPFHVTIIGGGPAGLMAAEVLSQAGVRVDLYDGMPSVGRKFLLAGVGGMNITHSEAYPAFLSRYAERASDIAPLLGQFGAEALCEWIHGLGIETFVGSSGRVFPTDMKAAPLLRAWLKRLRDQGGSYPHPASLAGLECRRRLNYPQPGGREDCPQRCRAAGPRWWQLVAPGLGRCLAQVAGRPRRALHPAAAQQLRLRGVSLERINGEQIRRRAAEKRRHRVGG